MADGAAPESNRPTAGLRRRTGFEDRLGHRARATPRRGFNQSRGCAPPGGAGCARRRDAPSARRRRSARAVAARCAGRRPSASRNAGERDRVERAEQLAASVVEGRSKPRGRRRRAAAGRAPRGTRRAAVVELRDPLLLELHLELGRSLRALAEARRRAREVDLRAAPLDLEQVRDVRRPRLLGQQLGRARRPDRAGSSSSCVASRCLTSARSVVEPRTRRSSARPPRARSRAPARARAARAARAPAAPDRSPARARERARSSSGSPLSSTCEPGRLEASGRSRVENDARRRRSSRCAGSRDRRAPRPPARRAAVARSHRRERPVPGSPSCRRAPSPPAERRRASRARRRAGTRPGSGPARRARRRGAGRAARRRAG